MQIILGEQTNLRRLMVDKYSVKGTNLHVALIAIGMHQSIILFGINISIADLFLLFFIIKSIYQGKIEIPLLPMLFFIFISISTISTSIVLVPLMYGISPPYSSILLAWLKLFTLFLYFVAGYLILKQNLERSFIIPFAYAGMAIGVLGIILSVAPVAPFDDFFFFGEVRYRGFIMDPNLYSVTTIAAFIAFLSYKEHKIWIRFFAWVILFWVVLLSASRTGFVVALCMLVFIIIRNHLAVRRVRIQSLIISGLIALATLLLYFFQNILMNGLMWLSISIPGVDRILLLLSHFESTLGESGSDRLETWGNALKIIAESPLFGIGIGTYGDVGNVTFGNMAIAHNTYLQLAAEWGCTLAFLFFAYLCLAVYRYLTRANVGKVHNAIFDVTIIFLIASMAISLNNARVFWICFGAMVCTNTIGKRIRSRNVHMLTEAQKGADCLANKPSDIA